MNDNLCNLIFDQINNQNLNLIKIKKNQTINIKKLKNKNLEKSIYV